MNAKFKIGIISICFGALMIVGCSKKDANNISNILTEKMSATIDGKAWDASVKKTVKNTQGFIITGTQVNSSLVSSIVAIQIFGTTTGTYNVVAVTNNCAATYTPDLTQPSNSFASSTGTVHLSEVNTSNKTISGTFSFECIDLSLKSVSITNGTFTALSYTESGK